MGLYGMLNIYKISSIYGIYGIYVIGLEMIYKNIARNTNFLRHFSDQVALHAGVAALVGLEWGDQRLQGPNQMIFG